MIGETTFTSLREIVPDWVIDSFESCLLQFFVSFFDINNSEIMIAINKRYERFDTGYPVFLRVIELKGMELMGANVAFSKPREGSLSWHHHVDKKKIEPGVYALVGAPLGDEAQARSALESFIAMLTILYGASSVYSLAWEVIIDCKNDSYSFTSPIIENPAFFAIDHFNDVPLAVTFDILKQVEFAAVPVRSLINVALSFVKRAVGELHGGIKLTSYFSAIDVLAGDVSKNNVCRLIGVSHKDLEELGFTELASKRNDFVHRGQTVRLERNEERLLQYLILDLVCGRIGFKSPAFARNYYLAAASRAAGAGARTKK